eukprot:TRINITY_DN11250_c0_g2_i1.p1 TRINITY_DN11250_c0_g2~~TRINITY_DN11250_c0_g2_i1.p1  ORF type:complete len:620 (+),score=143.35 TRINITY_DN11250_c0_g2_i1:58-1917(+)
MSPVIAFDGNFMELAVNKTIHNTNRSEITIRKYEGVDVVCKRFRMCDEEAIDRFDAEVSLLTKLSEDSIFVARPVGKIHSPPTYAVVLPYFPYGSMDTVIHSFKYEQIPYSLREQFAADLCAAVLHGHSRGIVIRDIKPANMLVDVNLNTALADLELAKPVEDLQAPTKVSYQGPSSRRKTRFEGTPEYMAPELLKAPGSQLQRGAVRASYCTDVYSVAISVNEIFTLQVPYTDVERTVEQLHTVVETRYSPSALHQVIIEEDVRPHLALFPSDSQVASTVTDLIKKGWSKDASIRPDIKSYCSILKKDDSIDRKQYLVKREKTDEVQQKAKEEVVSRTWVEVLRSITSEPPDGRAGVIPKVINGKGEGTAGRRDFMEDVVFQHEWLSEKCGARLFGILDGHGGIGCAEFVAENLPLEIERQILSSNQNIADSLKKAFIKTQEKYLQAKEKDDFSGACCTVAVILESHLWVAWCGDCSCVVVRSDSEEMLTRDHHPDRADEEERIKSVGGTVSVTADGKKRVGGRVAVSRSFGDEATRGVTAEPEVTHMALRSMDEELVLATDGVWDAMTPSNVRKSLSDTVRHSDYGAKRVVMDAFNQGSTDNIAAVVIYFNNSESEN